MGDDGAVEVYCYYCHGLFLYGVIVRVAIVAVAVIASVPIIILFLTLSKYFFGGSTMYSSSKE